MIPICHCLYGVHESWMSLKVLIISCFSLSSRISPFRKHSALFFSVGQPRTVCAFLSLTREKIHHCSVRVGTIDIKPVKVARNLGAHFSMSTHISMSCSEAFFWLHNIKRISQFLSRDKLEMVLHAFVTSRIDYCNGLLYGLPDCEIAKLTRVQNAAARLLMSCKSMTILRPF